jgi:hypothetical protein
MATQFSTDLRKIRTSKKLVGIEWIFDPVIFCLKYLVLIQWILKGYRWSNPYRVTDLYVVITTILSATILIWSDYAPLLSALVASYLLAGTIINIANVVFLTKVFGQPISNERTLLLFIFNVAQVVLTFAIWYRYAPGMRAGEALFKAMLVFGTVGYPKGADLIVGIQIATDIFLVAIFLAFILGNLGRERH